MDGYDLPWDRCVQIEAHFCGIVPTTAKDQASWAVAYPLHVHSDARVVSVRDARHRRAELLEGLPW
jgi:hypothetical protein